MRYALIAFIFLLGRLYAPAQSIGPDINKTGDFNPQLQKVVPLEEEGFVALLLDVPADPTSLTIRTFDSKDSLRAQQVLTLSDRGLPAQFEGAFRWGDRLTVLTSIYYPGPRRNNLILRQYSLPDLEELNAEFIEEAYTPRDMRIPFGYSLSPDRSRLLVYGWSYSLPDDPVRLKLRVFDRNLETEWEHNYMLPIKNETFYLYGSLLDAQGNAYLLCEEYQGNPSRFGGINERKIKQIILYGGKDLEEPRQFAIEPGKLILSGIRFALDQNNQLVGAGLYRKRNRGKYEGFITVRIDGPADQIRHQLLPVNKDQYKNAAVEVPGRQPRGTQQYNFSDFTVDHLFLQDSALYVLGEQFTDDPSQYPPFESNDILIARINQDRYLDWFVRIPKRQEGFWEDLGKFSYRVFQKDDELQLLYNNLNASRSGTTGNTVFASIRENGTVEFNDVSGEIRSRQPVTPYPLKSWSLGKEQLLLFGIKREKNTMEALVVRIPWEELEK